MRGAPDTTASELKGVLQDRGVIVSTSTVYRALGKLGYTHKKLAKQALEPDAIVASHVSTAHGSVSADHCDESAVDGRMAERASGWGLQCSRAHFETLSIVVNGTTKHQH